MTAPFQKLKAIIMTVFYSYGLKVVIMLVLQFRVLIVLHLWFKSYNYDNATVQSLKAIIILVLELIFKVIFVTVLHFKG